MGWGFRTLLGDILVLGFLSIVSPMKEALRISLTSLPVNMDYSESCGNIGNVLFLCSSGCISSSSSKSVYTMASFLCSSRLELGPTPSS
jgi:hypothetical protein